MVNGVIFWYLKLWQGSLCNDLLAVASSGAQTAKGRPGMQQTGGSTKLSVAGQLGGVCEGGSNAAREGPPLRGLTTTRPETRGE